MIMFHILRTLDPETGKMNLDTSPVYLDGEHYTANGHDQRWLTVQTSVEKTTDLINMLVISGNEQLFDVGWIQKFMFDLLVGRPVNRQSWLKLVYLKYYLTGGIASHVLYERTIAVDIQNNLQRAITVCLRKDTTLKDYTITYDYYVVVIRPPLPLYGTYRKLTHYIEELRARECIVYAPALTLLEFFTLRHHLSLKQHDRT